MIASITDLAITPPAAFRILVVDDDQIHRMLIREVLSEPRYLITEAESGQRALELIASNDFDAVLLDRRMPGMDGDQVCREVRQRLQETLLPIVMVTGSTAIEDLTASLQAGANDFISKPYSHIELRARVDAAVQRKQLTDQLDNAETLLFALARMVEAKDSDTGDHCSRLAYSAVAFGRALGLGDDDLQALRRGGILHDIGKLAIPDGILLKKGPLTASEWTLMQQHPAIGAHLCHSLKTMSTTLDIIHYHHEKWDGSGYPAGLSDEQIPSLARVFQLCDIYDALAHARPYKVAFSLPRIIAILEDEMDKGWRDPLLTATFLNILRHQPEILQAPAEAAEDLGNSLYEGIRLMSERIITSPK